jgi:hypothetical protein
MSDDASNTRGAIQRRLDEACAHRDAAVMERATAAAFAEVEKHADRLAGIAIPAVVARRAAHLAVKAAAPILREYGRWEANNAITWDTTCLNDARLLDSCYEETMRAEKAEAALADMIGLAVELLATHDGCCPWDRVTRACVVLGKTETENEDA